MRQIKIYKFTNISQHQKIDDVTKKQNENEQKLVTYEQLVAQKDELERLRQKEVNDLNQKIQGLEDEKQEQEARYVEVQYNLSQMTQIHETSEVCNYFCYVHFSSHI